MQERIDFVSSNAKQNPAFSPFSFLVTAVSGLATCIEIVFYFACGIDKIDTIKTSNK